MKLTGLLLFLLPAVARAENYQCQSDEGCTAMITEDGEVTEHSFRKGDIVSTEDGWTIPPDEGWEKVRAEKYDPLEILRSAWRWLQRQLIPGMYLLGAGKA